jgi:hypothetical protein
MSLFLVKIIISLASFVLVKGSQTKPGSSVHHCEYAIIGGGWGGTYFAWRATVDEDFHGSTPLWPAEKTCLFEAVSHVGGRAYSKSGIPGMQDIRIDMGAYRFDTHNHPLVNHVMEDVLNRRVKCYQNGMCNADGNLSVVLDAYGNNAGYAKGPEGLVHEFETAGGHVYFNHVLHKIDASRVANRSVKLIFDNGVSVDVKEVFLNLPAPAIRTLDKTSILFTEATNETKYALDYPQQMRGAKQFLIYPRAPWRKFPGLQAGLFEDLEATPPVQGRFHDFYGKCPDTDNIGDCWGAIMTYYDFPDTEERVKHELEYFASFQKNLSDPYTYVPNNSSATERERRMIKNAHENFLQAIIRQNVPGFNDLKILRTFMPEPSGTVIAVWWARDGDKASSIRPPPSVINYDNTLKYMSDPTHAFRNLVSKPLVNYPIYLANEAYSGGDGWAEPSLEMTERVLWHFFQRRPKWISESCYKQCLMVANSTGCKDCVSITWWAQTIASDPPASAHTLIPNCEKNSHQIVELIDGECKVQRDHPCKTTQEYLAEGISLSWQWLNAYSIHVMVRANVNTGWVGIGFGKTMFNADMVIALVTPEETVKGTRKAIWHNANSTGQTRPKILEAENQTVSNVTAYFNNKEKFITLSFTRNISSAKPSITMNPIAVDSFTPIILAVFDEPLETNHSFPQHTRVYEKMIDFSCGAKVPVGFEEDIRPLFRTKDINAMMFQLDLNNYTQVYAVKDDIFDRLKAKSFLGLPTGMPKDIAWSLDQILIYQKWLLSGAHQNHSYADPPSPPAEANTATNGTCSSTETPTDAHVVGCSSTAPPTFWKDIRPLFRPFDRNAMLFMGDLWDPTFVAQNAVKIYAAVAGKLSMKMPCDGPWPEAQVSLFHEWIACGKLVGDPKDNTQVNAREIYYRVFNMNYTYEPMVKNALDFFLAEAWEFSKPENCKPPQGYPYQCFQNYTIDGFETLLNGIYRGLVEDAATPVEKELDHFQTIEQAHNRFIQMAPFNLIDGAWISRCCPPGPINEVHSMLWGILTDEMGNGDVPLNHCQIYEELLHSIGFYYPKVNTKDFAYDQRFLDSAFTQPAYALALSYFSEDYFPELLGTTLQIEWTVLGSIPAIKLMKYYGINPHFYELHVGIDNASKGHAYRAKRAIQIYLDNARLTGGEEAVQTQWRRIWNGFLAFDALGTLGIDMNNLNDQMLTLTPQDQIIDLMNNKSAFGSLNHRTKRLGETHINDLFKDPKKFVHELKYSAWVVPGNADKSPIMHYLTTASGPMYKVFDETELELWRNWIWSLKPSVIQSGKLDSYNGMQNVVKRLMKTATAVEAHHQKTLWGPSPNNNNNNNNNLVEQSVANWLETVDSVGPDYLMKALIHPKNKLIVCGHPEQSPFITHVIMPGNKMGARYAMVAAEAFGLEGETYHLSSLWTWRDIVYRWVNESCPMQQIPGHTFSLFPEVHSKALRAAQHPPQVQQLFNVAVDAEIATLRMKEQDARYHRRGRHYVH